MTVRRALQLSLNVPAVAVLDKVGASRFTARLAQAGGALVLPKGEVPGLAMGLGGVGVSSTDLVALYAGLARLGTTVPLSERIADGAEAPVPRRLLDPVAAWYVGNVLLGTPPPDNAAGGRIAYKTGTSYGYRDAWAVGFDGRRTIGVWVGRPDGAPVPGLVGRAAAAPILFDAFARTGKLPAMPAGCAERRAGRRDHQIAAAAAALPPGGSLSGEGSEPQLRIMFPPNGARLELAAERRRQARSDRAQDHRRRRAAHRAGQRPAAVGGARPPHAVLRAGRSGLRAPHRDGRKRRHRQRHGAVAVALVATTPLAPAMWATAVQPTSRQCRLRAETLEPTRGKC